MKKFLLPLTTTIAALLANSPVCAIPIPLDDLSSNVPLPTYSRPISKQVFIPEELASLVLTNQSGVQLAGHRSHSSHRSHRSHRSGR
jgi:hypothetical protein